MVIPYYISPERLIQDKIEYAKKGVAKGRSVIVIEYRDGILLIADNPTSSLNKISEIYDNIALAGAGKYNEFESLRRAGVRHADIKGYSYSREDVTAKSLVNAYSQTMGAIFSQEIKPLEVEIILCEVGEEGNSIYKISFDGSISDEIGYSVIGGDSETLKSFLKDKYKEKLSINEVLKLSIDTFRSSINKEMDYKNLEVAILDKGQIGRKFRRIFYSELIELIK